MRGRRVRNKSGDPSHKPQKICGVCANLTERRPMNGRPCPGCKGIWIVERAPRALDFAGKRD
jgi:hypothetical protein